jgi:surface-anchored protein
MFTKMKSLVGAALGLALLAGSAVRADSIYSRGHGDVGAGYEDGELKLHLHLHSGAVVDGSPLATDEEYDPSDLIIKVSEFDLGGGDTNPFERPAGSQWDFLGTAPGGLVWYLPQVGSVATAGGVPFLGIATEELDDNWTNVRFELVSVNGFNGASKPGEFSLWKDGRTGPQVLMASYDGIDGTDSFTMPPGLHDHANWGFSAAGFYEVTWRISGNHATDGFRSSTSVLQFAVGPDALNVIPEPSSIALAGLGGLALGAAQIVRRRRARTSA